MNLLGRIRALFADNNAQMPVQPEADAKEAEADKIATFANEVTGATLLEFPTPKVTPASVTHQLNPPVDAEGLPKTDRGLLHSLELQDFFADNFFGYGCHNGLRLRTQEGLAQGKQAIVSRFQRILSQGMEGKRARIRKLELEQTRISGIDAATTRQLDLATEQARQDIEILQDQIALSEDERGWVRNAIDQYHAGYVRGVRDSVDCELLGLS